MSRKGPRFNLPPELPAVVGNEKWWINKILTDIFFFCKVVLHHGKKKEYRDLNWFHRELCYFIERNPILQKLIIVFRDGLKSSIARAKLIQWFLKKRWNREEGKAFIFCGIADLAEDHAERVWKEIVNNRIIQYLFNTWMVSQGLRPLLPTKQSEFESCSSEKIRYKGIEIDVGSPEKSLTGHHYELGIIDNLVNEKNSEHPDQRDKVYLRWRQSEALLAEEAEELIFETTWWPDDLSGRILHTEGKFNYSTIKGKVCHRFISEIGYAVFYCPAEDKSGNPVFPEKVDRKYLDRKRAKMGSYLYSALYLLQPIAEEDVILRTSWLYYYKELPNPYIRNLIIDCAGTKKEGSSYTGMSEGEWDVDGILHIPWVGKRKLSVGEVCDWAIERLEISMKIGRPIKNIGIEREKFGLALYDMLKRENVQKRFGVMVHLLTIANMSGDERVDELVPLYEQKKILFAEGLKEYEDEHRSYYRKKKKGRDLLDTIFYQVKLKRIPKKVEKPDFVPVIADDFTEQLKRIQEGQFGNIKEIAARF